MEAEEQQRFLHVVGGVAGIKSGGLSALNIRVDPRVLDKAPTIPSGIFR